MLFNILPETLKKTSLAATIDKAKEAIVTGGATASQEAENLVANFESSQAGGALVDQFDDFSNKATDFVESDQFSEATDIVANKLHSVAGEVTSKLNSAGNVINEIPGGGQKDASDAVKSFLDSKQGQNITKQVQIIGQQVGQFVRNFKKGIKKELPSLQPNVLENFVSSNYVISLGVLSNRELERPNDTYYKNGEPETMIIKSGGGSQSLGSKKVMTSFERAAKGPPSEIKNENRVEFFIEDLQIESVITPNASTRMATINKFSFKVLEPYSMGQFLEALAIGARRAGHQNYIGAPFILMLDWVGHLENGQTARLGDFDYRPSNGPIGKHRKRFLPLKLLKSGMRVNAGGSEYEINAVAFNDMALSDVVQQIPGDIEIEGDTVAKVLQTGVNSLTTKINEVLLKRDADNKFKFADEYVILFPTKLGSEDEFDEGNDEGAIKDLGTIKAVEEARKQYNLNPNGTNEEQLNKALEANQMDFEAWTKKNLGISVTRDKKHESFKDSLQEDANINKIGKSEVQFSFLQGGNTKNLPDGFVYDEKKEVYVLRNMQIPKNGRAFRFTKNTKINNIIEEIVIQSNYGRQLREAASKDGTKEWFKIETQTYNIPVYEVEATKGRFPKLYVFRVVPYHKHSGVWTTPTATAEGVKEIKKKVVKNYEYIYTGENKDVIDFDLNFEYRFITQVSADHGATTKDRQNPGQFATTHEANLIRREQSIAEGEHQNKTQVFGPHLPVKEEEKIKTGWKSIREMPLVNISKSGIRAVPAGEADQIARDFHEATVNHNVDLMRANLEIWGDPYFISDSGMGNYNSKGNFEEYVDEHGMMHWQNKSIYINLNFRTPFDYDKDGRMAFPTVGGKRLEHFSGLYQPIRVTSNFSKGSFRQTLTLLRMNNQTGEANATDNAPVQANPHKDTNAQTGVSGQDTVAV